MPGKNGRFLVYVGDAIQRAVLSRGGLVQFFGPDTSSTATLGSDISLTHRAWRDQSDNGSQHASADRPLDVLIVTSEAPPIISGISTCVARLAGGGPAPRPTHPRRS